MERPRSRVLEHPALGDVAAALRPAPADAVLAALAVAE